MTRRLHWGVPDAPPTQHPYRDTLLVYGGLAAAIVVFAWLTGGAVGRAAGIAGVFFVVASAWSSYRLRVRLAKDRGRAEAAEE